MKTTVDIADALLKRARDIAKSEGTSLSTLIEEGLRVANAARHKPHSAQLALSLVIASEAWQSSGNHTRR